MKQWVGSDRGNRCGTRAWFAQCLLLVGVTLLVIGLAACQPINPATLRTLEAAQAVAEQEATANAVPMIEVVGSEGAMRDEGLTLADGTVISYTVVLPPNYIAGTPYPTLLALPPGSQTQSMVDAGLSSYWQAGALTHGWVVVSPAAPDDQLFFQGSERYIPEFLTAIAALYPPEGEKFHLGGVSNGGISAFRIAGTNPERFHSLIALPGYPQTPEDRANLDKLVDLPVALFVGSNDVGWVGSMREAVSMLNNRGGHATLEIVADEGHFIRSLIGGEELFVLLEEFRVQ